MGYRVVISNIRNWWYTPDPNMSIGAPFILNMYMSRVSFSFCHFILLIERTLNILMGSYMRAKWKRREI